MTRSSQCIVFTGGGTAGHVWPHFALLDDSESELRRAVDAGQLSIHYIGSCHGMERDIVKNAPWKITYHGIQTGKLRRYFSMQNFTDPFKILTGIIQCFFLLARIRPQVVFSKGGFVSAPVVWAAGLFRIPVVIHESDVTPALATKLSYFFARQIFCAFEDTLKQIPLKYRARAQCVGLPLRKSLFSASKEESLRVFNLGAQAHRPTILVFGGSLGAEGLNRKVADCLPQLCHKYNVIHIVGKGKSFSFSPSLEGYRQYEFLADNMKYAYGCADVALCRAGASSLFELAAARIPMVLVPLGMHQSRGDQYVNARIFAQKNWAEWVDEEALTPSKILELIDGVVSHLAEKKAALLTSPGPDAARKVASSLWKFCKKTELP